MPHRRLGHALGHALVTLLQLSWALVPPLAPATAQAAIMPAVPEPPPALAWAPPVWLPDGGPVSPWALEALAGPPTRDDAPPTRSAGVFVADLDRGEVLLARGADEARPVASLTKLVAALAWASEERALDDVWCVTPEQYPPRPGGRSAFHTGACHVGWEWLGAALVHSDNRAAMGLPALSGLSYDEFLDRMAEVSDELGLERATWTDPSGLEEGDAASARDMARAAVAVAGHPVLSELASAPSWTVQVRGAPRELRTTNRLIARWETLAAKTGYTDPAGYCFAQVIRGEHGGTLVVVVLGAPSSAARFAEATALAQWADALP